MNIVYIVLLQVHGVLYAPLYNGTLTMFPTMATCVMRANEANIDPGVKNGTAVCVPTTPAMNLE
jgi:hypothetical protein